MKKSRGMKFIAACCMMLAALLPAIAAAQKKQPQKVARKPPVKIEKLACRLGTEDEHARIAVQLANGKVDSFAYYSKWKPRTCSMDVTRNDAYSKWEDTGNVTIVTLIEEKGAFLIDHAPGRYHFIFRDIDRMRYCGMEGKVNGTLTIFRGRPQCQVSGVMDREMKEAEIKKPAAAEPEAKKPVAADPEIKKPVAVEPDVKKPVAVEPEIRKPAAGEPEIKKPMAEQSPAPKPAGKEGEAKPGSGAPAITAPVKDPQAPSPPRESGKAN